MNNSVLYYRNTKALLNTVQTKTFEFQYGTVYRLLSSHTALCTVGMSKIVHIK